MADNNKNPRRTIWLSETEPLSHYDIWLSKNQHLNSEGEPVSDNGVQRPCDYIFKVWDCDNWYPIIGLNATAVNKIDTVLNVGYTDSNDEYHYSYEEFHLPMFTKPVCSPAELFDGGTVAQVIKKYVSKEDWKEIFEGDIINSNLEPAAHEYLGGIWADMFNSSTHADALTVSNTYLAQAKYKYQSTQNDYNLYVHAKDIIPAINHLTENDENYYLNIDFATETYCGGILSYKHPNNIPKEVGVQVRFVPQNINLHDVTYGIQIPYHNLAIRGKQIIDAISNYEPTNPNEWDLPVKGLYGIDSLYTTFYDEYGEEHNGYALKLSHYPVNEDATNEEEIKKYCRTKKYVSQPIELRSGNTNEWSYYDTIDSNHRINYGLEWLTGEDLIKEETGYDENTMGNTKVYLCCNQGTLGWDEGPEGGEYYTAGYGIKFNIDNDNTEINQDISEVSVASSSIPGGSVLSIKWDGESDNNIQLDKYITQGEDTTLKKIFIYEYLKLSGSITLTINLIAENKLPFFNPNPIYIYADNISKFYIEAGNNIIDDENLVTLADGTVSPGLYLITIQFGAIKIEQIKTVTFNNEP